VKFLRVAVGCLAFTLLALSLVQGSAASAATNYTLFGDATLVSPGHDSQTAAQLRSNAGGVVFGGVDFTIAAGTTLGDLRNLSTEYMFTASSCGGGAPRFQINIDGTNINVYLGPPPSYTLCAQNIWTPSGDLLEPASFVDTSKLPGGTFYDTWAAALVKYGTHAVTGIQLVTDSSWFFGGATQTVLVDNVRINATHYTFEANAPGSGGGSFAQCKNGGWRNFTSAPGPFRNQGECVSFFARGKHHGQDKHHGEDGDHDNGDHHGDDGDNEQDDD
jgi:hypothetical protein